MTIRRNQCSDLFFSQADDWVGKSVQIRGKPRKAHSSATWEMSENPLRCSGIVPGISQDVFSLWRRYLASRMYSIRHETAASELEACVFKAEQLSGKIRGMVLANIPVAQFRSDSSTLRI